MKDNHKMNEFRDCLNKYFDGSTNAITVENICDFANEFFMNANQIVFRDNPDGYLKIADKFIIIEHFEYDATKRNKKGSETRIEDSRINRRLNNLNNSSLETKYVHDQMNVIHSTEYLKDNFIKVFTEHNDKINQYKDELSKEGIIDSNSDVLIVFCCEDKTTFGCLAYDNNKYYSFSVIDIKECLDVILKSNVDYLLLCNSYQNDKCINILPVSNEILKVSKNKMFNEISMIDFKPQVIGASKFVPNK